MKTILNLLLLLFITAHSFGQNTVTANTNLQSDSYLKPTTQLTLSAGVHITTLARTMAKTLNKEVTIAVVDASGQLIILSRGDGVGVHNTEAARRKAFTAASTKTATLILGRNAKANPDTQNLAYLPELLLLGGGAPIVYKGEIIGAIGVAGGGSPENDNLIAKSAIQKFSECNIN